MQILRQQTGFTLIEVMVALAVAAIALAALSQASGNLVWNQTALEQRVIGNWVAQNEIVQLQTGLLPAPRSTAKLKQMGHQWQLRSRTKSTPVPGIVKLQVEVFPEEEASKSDPRPVASLVTVWGQKPQ